MQKLYKRWLVWVRGIRARQSVLQVGRSLLFPALLILLLGTVIVSIGSGAVAISPPQVLSILCKGIGIDMPVPYEARQEAVLWVIRLPRVALGVLVGAALAMAGATMQGIFRNPLADPGLIGVSSGAAFTAVACIVLNLTVLNTATLPVAAFIGGALSSCVIYGMARQHRRTEVLSLLLTGVALSAMTGAGTAILTYFATDQQLRSITFWSMGSLSGATWETVRSVAPFILVSLLVIPFWGRQLNLLMLGEREARHLGVDTERLRMLLIVFTALMTSAAVAVCGIIGFVGLVVPHLIRLLVGPDHRILLPASALLGAALLLLADLGARTLVMPTELPLGALTAFCGGPFFLFLIHHTRRRQSYYPR